MHVSLQILSPAAAQAYGVHENWSGSKGDILWRKRLKGNSSASLPPSLTFVCLMDVRILLRLGCVLANSWIQTSVELTYFQAIASCGSHILPQNLCTWSLIIVRMARKGRERRTGKAGRESRVRAAGEPSSLKRIGHRLFKKTGNYACLPDPVGSCTTG